VVPVTRIDWIAVAIAVLGALTGLRRGLVATALSLAGLAAGAVVGARLAPHLLHGGALSPYTPLAGLGGALVGAAVLQWVAAIAGSFARGGLSVIPPLRLLDSLGGLLAGAALGLALVWVAGAVLLELPGETKLRTEAQSSIILRRLNQIAPPRTFLRTLARIDPFPQIAGPAPPSTPPDARVLRAAPVRAARRSVVRITAVACGLGVEGSGWVAKPHIVVTAAHVVAGGTGLRVNGRLAHALVVDRKQDVAVLRVPTLKAPALPLAQARHGDPVAILGFPVNGPFDARAGRIGNTADVLVDGALREVTALNGLVRHGNSGGPAVNRSGRVEATVFAARIGSKAGYGVPAAPVQRALARAKGPISTGSC
jgi:S1-C subfamily serine protease